MAGTALILRNKRTDERGNLLELVIWKVKSTPRQPDAIRYRLALVRPGAKTPAVLYDNHHPKGHHRHYEGVEVPYDFVDVDRLIADFIDDVRRITGADE